MPTHSGLGKRAFPAFLLAYCFKALQFVLALILAHLRVGVQAEPGLGIETRF